MHFRHLLHSVLNLFFNVLPWHVNMCTLKLSWEDVNFNLLCGFIVVVWLSLYVWPRNIWLLTHFEEIPVKVSFMGMISIRTQWNNWISGRKWILHIFAFWWRLNYNFTVNHSNTCIAISKKPIRKLPLCLSNNRKTAKNHFTATNTCHMVKQWGFWWCYV